MGGCQSIILYEDDDERILRERNKQHAREMREFQRQLRLQKCHSELDMTGRVRVSSIASKEINKN